MDKNKISNFLTPDISYLLGLITGRGEIQQKEHLIVIDFEFKALESKAIHKVFTQKLHIQTSLDFIVTRLSKLVTDISKNVTNNKISLTFKWIKEDISWNFIKFLINGDRFSYRNFLIPNSIFQTNENNKKEFLRGLADVTAYVRNSNRDQSGRHRIYLEISNQNWYLPPQICHLSQSLEVPIQNINYGHPNLRDPKGKTKSIAWAKEHQIKIYAKDFLKIGFYISHKNEALQELAEDDEKNFSKNFYLVFFSPSYAFSFTFRIS